MMMTNGPEVSVGAATDATNMVVAPLNTKSTEIVDKPPIFDT